MPAPSTAPAPSRTSAPGRSGTGGTAAPSGAARGGAAARGARPAQPDRLVCQNPSCTRLVEQALRGRPRKYCGDSCRAASRSARIARTSPKVAVHDGYAREIAEEVRDRGDALGRLINRDAEDIVAKVREAHRLARDADDLIAALVQQAHDRKVPMREIAAALNISTDTVRRHWRSRPLEDRMRDRRRRNQSRTAPGPDSPTGPGGGSGVGLAELAAAENGNAAGPGRAATRAAPRTGGGAEGGQGAPDNGATALLARALSHLQRSSGKPLRTLGEEAGISASYISRVLSGERCPSWDVARRLTVACAGDPAEVRPLWDAARGHLPAHRLPDARSAPGSMCTAEAAATSQTTAPRRTIREAAGPRTAGPKAGIPKLTGPKAANPTAAGTPKGADATDAPGAGNGAGAAGLQAALRGLHLSAARPDPAVIRRSSLDQLSLDDICQLLNGPKVLDWPTVDRFVHALRGRCHDIWPLWDAVQRTGPGSGPGSGGQGPPIAPLG